MKVSFENIIRDFVDYLMPELTPHEASLYIFLLRNSHMKNATPECRIGQRTIAVKYGQGPKKSVPSRAHIVRQMKMLEEKGAIRIGDTTREGTLYTVFLPHEVSSVKEKLVVHPSISEQEDYFTNPAKRHEIFERDKWICFYCGDQVKKDNVTLDHYIPQSKGGKHTKNNLKTSCLLCNSIKSGKTYEEAAPSLLKSIRERKSKSLK